jgi:CRISPR-associated endonuclease Cas1
MQSGHLEIEDGPGEARRKFRLSRVGHGLKRLVIIGDDGFVSLSALKWISEVDAAIMMLDRTGRVIFVTGPTASSDARLRRAQALAASNGVGLEICRKLIDAKLEGQERLVREKLNAESTAQSIAELRNALIQAESIETVRLLEAQGAQLYFSKWRDMPVLWPKVDLRKVPEHWRTVGSRRSPLTGGPRLAVTPVHAILNYCFALLESETRFALSALGLDPGLGLGLHSDTPNRDSLALDVLEPVRPQVEEWVLSWITREPLHRADFFETANGNCRLMSAFCRKLSETAPVWGKLAAPWVEFVARTLWSKSAKSLSEPRLSTRLTQKHRREAKGQPSFPVVGVPRIDHCYRRCGRQVQLRNRLCTDCAAVTVIGNFDIGRKKAQSPVSIAKRSATQRSHKQAIEKWNPSDLPTWLTREVYLEQIQPQLASVAKARISTALHVSYPYVLKIQRGQCIPHARHWLALARLSRVSIVDCSGAD